MSRSSSQPRGRANSPAIPSPTENGPGAELPDSYEFHQSSMFPPARGAPARPRPPQIEWTANGPENYNGFESGTFYFWGDTRSGRLPPLLESRTVIVKDDMLPETIFSCRTNQASAGGRARASYPNNKFKFPFIKDQTRFIRSVPANDIVLCCDSHLG
ncbi:hypothetical protein EVAR_54554_1 [Eumeta japonica]|uniref:Uncharacterized protein n=1 Tax=Eumeta variegata TaxID=151549 RepID=A0A4C1YV00_EUMVA|nr:hypothetical protein EVAR_54554_1 [Eumeta japonica]